MIMFKRCLEKYFSDTKTAYIFLLYFCESLFYMFSPRKWNFS